MHAYDAHWLPYFITSSGAMQFREVCYTVVSYAPYILLQIYTITNLATFQVTIFDFFYPGPQPTSFVSRMLVAIFWQHLPIQIVVADSVGDSKAKVRTSASCRLPIQKGSFY